ncbi:MAG: S4 domain-containing protein, partial [Rhodococcus sp. (in: high G+C Gram-positive bacteria)]
DEATLAAALQETSVVDVAAGELPTIVDLLVVTGLCESKSAARRAVKEGGASVNNQKVSDEEWTPSADGLLHGRWLVVRRGKKNVAGARVIL